MSLAFAAVVPAGVVAGTLSIPAVVARYDQGCGACHLHGRLLEDARQTPPETSAGAHAARGALCIDCHRGSGLADLGRTEILAARDTLTWVLGNAREPEALTVPRLAQRSCARCHSARHTSRGFHTSTQHGLDGPVGCLDCHAAHLSPADGPAPRERFERGCLACHARGSRIVERYFNTQ